MMQRRILMAPVICYLLAATPPPLAEVQSLSLYEKTGRSPLVVWGEIIDGEHRFALTRALDVPKCEIAECPGETLRIVYKLDSFLRRPWEDKITFKTGEQVLLFLRKFTKEDGRQPDGDKYTLMWGAEGKMRLPEEGGKALVDAVHTFMEILSEPDLDEQERMLIEALSSKNPYVAETAFTEMLKQGLGTIELIPRLVPFFDHTRDSVRVLSMKLLRRILSDARVAAGGKLDFPDLDELSNVIRGRAALDPAPAFRVEAVITLAVLGGDQERALLERLADEDPSQLVRYEAERALLSWDH